MFLKGVRIPFGDNVGNLILIMSAIIQIKAALNYCFLRTAIPLLTILNCLNSNK